MSDDYQEYDDYYDVDPDYNESFYDQDYYNEPDPETESYYEDADDEEEQIFEEFMEDSYCEFEKSVDNEKTSSKSDANKLMGAGVAYAYINRGRGIEKRVINLNGKNQARSNTSQRRETTHDVINNRYNQIKAEEEKAASERFKKRRDIMLIIIFILAFAYFLIYI